MKSTSLKTFLTGMLVVGTLVACGDGAFQVIEELTFDESLGINLADFTMLNSGVYVRDVVVGTGDEALLDSVLTVDFTGHLADGSQFGTGVFALVIGGAGAIAGFEEGVFGMRLGGERRLIIPPERGYGNQDQANIPPGSVLIFDVELIEVGERPPEEVPSN